MDEKEKVLDVLQDEQICDLCSYLDVVSDMLGYYCGMVTQCGGNKKHT